MRGVSLRSVRLAWIAAALAAACGEASQPQPGPLGSIYKPTGIAVHHPAGGEARLVVASSNGDLRYDDESGGAILSIDPAGAGTTLGVNIRSFAGDLALATEAECGPFWPEMPGPLAITATRGSDTLNAVLLGPDRLSCHACDVPAAGPAFGDPFAAAVACGGGRARAYVGYLRGLLGQAWVSEYDLPTGALRHRSVGPGPVRAFAYDAARDRLYLVGVATSRPTPLRWIDLAGCPESFDLGPEAGGCAVGEAAITTPAAGMELRSIALAHPFPGAPQRAFVTARLYDLSSAALAGGRTSDYGGRLLVVDLVDNALGGVDAEVVWTEDIGRGAQDVRVLPSRGAGRRDVVAALAVDDGVLWIYDDESRVLTGFGRDELSGVPVLGREPFGLAVDPDAAGTAHVYVGSFRDSHVTPVDVPLETPDAAVVVSTAGAIRRITGGTP
jgi:hypothetical protein